MSADLVAFESGFRARSALAVLLLTAALGLSACGRGAVPELPAQRLDPTLTESQSSDVIAALLARRSILSPGPLTSVADAVLKAETSSAALELRAARLRAIAQEANWLPTFGPQINLTSLGQIATSLVIEQTVFDSGRRLAERAYAAADVENAAATLSRDVNARVLAALDLYLTAEGLSARVAITTEALDALEKLAANSTGADQALIAQKRLQLQADLAADRAAATGARAELTLLADGVAGVHGRGGLAGAADAEPLAVILAQTRANRTAAEAQAAAAGFMPGIAAVGQTGGGLGFVLGVPNNLGLGTGASLGALDEQGGAATVRVDEAREQAARETAALQTQIETLRATASTIGAVAQQAAENYDLFVSEGRPVPDTLGLFDTRLSTARTATMLPYDILRLQLRDAAGRGQLVDGNKI